MCAAGDPEGTLIVLHKAFREGGRLHAPCANALGLYAGLDRPQPISPAQEERTEWTSAKLHATRHVLPTKVSRRKATCLQCAGQPDTARGWGRTQSPASLANRSPSCLP